MKNKNKKSMEIVLSKDVNGTLVDGYFDDGQAWYTRSQIGEALGYSNPLTAIKNIHQRHKERLDKFSRVAQIELPSGVQEGYVYNIQGVFEICRWSKQPVADAVMDGLYTMAEEVMRKGYFSNLPPEKLLSDVAELCNDEQILRSVIIPAVQTSEAKHVNVIQQYLGLTDKQIENNPKLLKWAKETDKAKQLMKYWEYRKLGNYTLKDFPKNEIPEFIIVESIDQLKIKAANREYFADYCGETHFDRRGFDIVVDFLVKRGTITLEESKAWKACKLKASV